MKEVAVEVDEAGRDELARDVDHLGGGDAEIGRDGGDPAMGEGDVEPSVERLPGVEHGPAAQNEVEVDLSAPEMARRSRRDKSCRRNRAAIVR
ncbi:MAG TPA: hypothetical protein VML54_11095 [Candidatus Limnocylindrales bacterium]|nr:hypothetical protein [Candidatus Limnocylindrales bacterium]